MKTKVVIIGGGPSGLTAAIYCARAGLNPIVAAGEVNGSLIQGGQLMQTSEVENYPGFPKGISGPELMMKFKDQAETFGAKIIDKWAHSLQLTKGSPFTLQIGDQECRADCIIIATGAVAKWLNLPNEDKYKNNGISACATCDGPLRVFRNQHLFVVGGGDTAMEEALFLTKFASKVTIIHRRKQLRASRIMQEKAFNNPKIDFLWNSVIEEYQGDKYLTGLKIRNTETNEVSIHDAAGLFMGIGHNPMTNFLSNKTTTTSDIELNEQGYINVNNHVNTNIDGVFACGDVHDIHFKQAVTACGFGCMAAITAERWLEK